MRHLLSYTLQAARQEEALLRCAAAACAKDIFLLQRLRHEAASAPKRIKLPSHHPAPSAAAPSAAAAIAAAAAAPLAAPSAEPEPERHPTRADGLERFHTIVENERREAVRAREGTAS